MDELLKMCANVGFPIVVSLYLLARIERKLDCMIRLVLDLINLIDDDYKDNSEI